VPARAIVEVYTTANTPINTLTIRIDPKANSIFALNPSFITNPLHLARQPGLIEYQISAQRADITRKT
jgi:hypothetical protein